MVVAAKTSVAAAEAAGFWTDFAGGAQGICRGGVREESSKTLKGSGWSNWEDGVATARHEECWSRGLGGKNRN